jgi:hypothetical protein
MKGSWCYMKTLKMIRRLSHFLSRKKYYMKFENSVVTQNVTRDFLICLPHNFLILQQIVMKLWSFYPLIVVNSWIKYQDQKVCLSYTRGKILQKCHARFYSEKLSRKIITDITTSKLKQRWMHNISLDFYI